MAPCSASSTASQPFFTSSTIALVICSYAALVTSPDGWAEAAIGTVNSAPALRATSMKPPRDVLVSSDSLMACGPLSAPARAKDSMGVGSGENVLVSCIIIATTNFCATVTLLLLPSP